MLLVDLDLSLYAINSDAVQHERAREWWEGGLSGDDTVALPWVVVLGFLRISTNARILPTPRTVEQAMGAVDDWIGQAPVRLLEPTERHWPILRSLLEGARTAGNVTSDAHLAALANEHGATLCSADRDFGRFAHLRWRNPLES